MGMIVDEEQPTAPPQDQQMAGSTVKSSAKKKILWIGIIAILVVVTAVTLGVVLQNKGDGDDQSSSAAEQGGSDAFPEVGDNPESDATPVPSPIWPHEESDIAMDPNLRIGQLENGLRYMVYPHAWPEGQVSFRLHIDAGSLMEDDDQLG